jgi:hypothetical protein
MVKYIINEAGRLNILVYIKSDFGEGEYTGTSISNNIAINWGELKAKAIKDALIQHFYDFDKPSIEKYRYIDNTKLKLNYKALLDEKRFLFQPLDYMINYLERPDRLRVFKDRWGNERIGRFDIKTGKIIFNNALIKEEIEDFKEGLEEYTIKEDRDLI